MNKWEKQVQSSLLKDELRILKTLKLMYSDVMRETVERMELFFLRVSADPTDAAAVYQFRYQQALAEQLSAILDGFDERNYTTIEDYLKECYTTGYVGAMYDIHHQGIPVIEPIRQENVVRAITLNSKISVPMYTRLGTDIAQLKTAIAAEVTRGIASGHSWHDTAAGIARQGNVSAYNAMRIARTEGHRIACEAQMDGCRAAKEAGADVLKEWNAALDDRTREHHKLLNGQLRELDDAFEVDGIRVQYPGDFGRPEEDIHCRCALLQRARWALSEEELEKLQSTPEAKELAEIDDFGKFKDKYIEVTAQQVEDSEDVSAEKSTGNPPETVDFSAESGIIEDKEIARIRDEVIPAMNTETIAPRQDIHRQGTQMYLDRQAKMERKGEYGPSYLTIPDEKVLELVQRFMRTGDIKLDRNGKWNGQETIITNDEIVGYVVNNLNGATAKTSVFKIHYSKEGVHIVPDYPSKKEGGNS